MMSKDIELLKDLIGHFKYNGHDLNMTIEDDNILVYDNGDSRIKRITLDEYNVKWLIDFMDDFGDTDE